MRDIQKFLFGLIVTGLGALAATTVPNVFQPGTPIKAADVNANFTALQAGLNALETKLPLKTPDLADGSVTAPKLSTQNPGANGKFLSYNGQGLVWADGTAGTVGPQGPKGDPGPQGSPGVSGYQVLQGVFNLPPNKFSSDTLSCPSGKKIITGGYGGLSGQFIIDAASPLSDGSGYMLEVTNLNPFQIQTLLTIMCANVSP